MGPAASVSQRPSEVEVVQGGLIRGSPITQQLSQIVETDPSLSKYMRLNFANSTVLLVGGYRLVFDRMVPLELHVVDPKLTEKLHGRGLCASETMQIKICTMGPDDDIPSLIKVEILSKTDFYFMYEHVCDGYDFAEIRE